MTLIPQYNDITGILPNTNKSITGGKHSSLGGHRGLAGLICMAEI